MKYNFSDDFLVKENSKFEIKGHSTSYKGELDKDEAKLLLETEKEKLRALQEKLYADGSQSLLIILQAMDAAGKDSLIEHVFGGVNPQDVRSQVLKVRVPKIILMIFFGVII